MIIAFDCDLRESYCVSDTGIVDRGPNPLDLYNRSVTHCGDITVLFEIASPVSFNRAPGSNAAMYQLAKWAIWNVAFAAQLMEECGRDDAELLVAPSNVWTRGFDEKTRHAMAKCKQPKKDLRECEAMLWFYKHRPQDWKPLTEYLANL